MSFFLCQYMGSLWHSQTGGVVSIEPGLSGDRARFRRIPIRPSSAHLPTLPPMTATTGVAGCPRTLLEAALIEACRRVGVDITVGNARVEIAVENGRVRWVEPALVRVPVSRFEDAD